MRFKPPKESDGKQVPCAYRGFEGKEGLSVIETLVASTILAFGMIGAVSMFQWAAQGASRGVVYAESLALLENRLEAKRMGPWEQLLSDDLDGDGVAELVMRDDGQGKDVHAGDGTYTGAGVSNGVSFVWTVALDRPGPLWKVGSVRITCLAKMRTTDGAVKTFKMGVIRTNPRFLGKR